MRDEYHLLLMTEIKKIGINHAKGVGGGLRLVLGLAQTLTIILYKRKK